MANQNNKTIADEREAAIKVENLSKTFRVPHEKHTSLKFTAINMFKKKTYSEFHALENIELEIKKGEFFGIIGRNGSGKSTLLKILAGIYVPDSGKITINGKLSPFLELGVGFNPELTGRENLYLGGSILGLSHEQVTEKYEEIVNFAEIEEFIDMRLKNYSSGMQVRLAFSLAINAHAEILLMDEVLAVGDKNFQSKCLDEFAKYKKEGKTVILVTHAMEYVREYCDRAVLIDRGNIKYLGSPEKAIDAYSKINLEEMLNANSESDAFIDTGFIGNGKAVIRNQKVLDLDGKETKKLISGEHYRILMTVEFKEDVESPVFGVMFRDATKDIFGIHSLYSRNPKEIELAKGGEVIDVNFDFENVLVPGNYTIMVACASQKSFLEYEILHLKEKALRIAVSSQKYFWGPLNLNAKISFEKSVMPSEGGD